MPWLLLVAVTTMPVVGPAAAVQEVGMAFEVASVRPVPDGRLTRDEVTATMVGWVRPGGVFTATKITAFALLVYAFDVRPYQVVGGPAWLSSDRFTVDGRAGRDVPESEIKLMVQALLRHRFRLTVHRERREMRYRALVLARDDGRLGPYMLPCTPETSAEVRKKFPPRHAEPDARGGMMTGGCNDVARMEELLSLTSGLPVLDKTGLKGKYAYDVRYVGDGASTLSGAFADAFEDQLGLKFRDERGPIDVLVVDAIEQPSEN